jgi:hypothetical protein
MTTYFGGRGRLLGLDLVEWLSWLSVVVFLGLIALVA